MCLLVFAQQSQFRFRPLGADSPKSRKKYISDLEYAHRKIKTQVPGEISGETKPDPYAYLVQWLRGYLDLEQTNPPREDQKPNWITDV